MRVENWEVELNAVIQKHLDLPHAVVFGVSDCYMIPDDAVKAITGERIHSGVRYGTEAGAGKQLLKRGFENVEQAFADKFAEIPVLQAGRGDIGVVVSHDGSLSGGVFTALGFMTRVYDGSVYFLPVTDVKTAFKVD